MAKVILDSFPPHFLIPVPSFHIFLFISSPICPISGNMVFLTFPFDSDPLCCCILLLRERYRGFPSTHWVVGCPLCPPCSPSLQGICLHGLLLPGLEIASLPSSPASFPLLKQYRHARFYLQKISCTARSLNLCQLGVLFNVQLQVGVKQFIFT